MVVIAILAILIAIVAMNISGTRVKAAVTAHNSNARALQSAVTLAQADCKDPLADAGKKIEIDSKTTVGSLLGAEYKGADKDTAVLVPKYVNEWPKVPSGIKGKFLEKQTDGSFKETKVDLTGKVYTIIIDEDGKVTVNPGEVQLPEKIKGL